ncbi:MAG: phosphoenolpyruvate hydrolase family protein, partial [Pseudolabrys sp.]
MARIARSDILAKFNAMKARGEPIIGAGAGTGISAKGEEKGGADLIVLRRRGKRSYLANLFLGEMVHTVVGHTRSDVLTVPRASEFWSRGILVATDGSPQSARATKMAAALDNVEFIIAPTNSYWTRDYGPWFVFDGNGDIAVIDHRYNRPRPHDDVIPYYFALQYGLPCYQHSMWHTGGNYMTDGAHVS